MCDEILVVSLKLCCTNSKIRILKKFCDMILFDLNLVSYYKLNESS